MLSIKFDVTSFFTFLLLFIMIGGGAASGVFGYKIGSEALKGVSKPDARPPQKVSGGKPIKTDPNKFEIIKESEVLKQVKNQMKNPNRDTTDKTSSKKDDKKDNQKLPISTNNQGVKLEIKEIKEEESNLVLSVNLKNESDKELKFLYSFLDVTDDKGQSISAVTQGLPAEVPANSDVFTGTVSIPTALIKESKELSMSLTDYPDQKLQLKLSKIPVKP